MTVYLVCYGRLNGPHKAAPDNSTYGPRQGYGRGFASVMYEPRSMHMNIFNHAPVHTLIQMETQLISSSSHYSFLPFRPLKKDTKRTRHWLIWIATGRPRDTGTHQSKIIKSEMIIPECKNIYSFHKFYNVALSISFVHSLGWRFFSSDSLTDHSSPRELYFDFRNGISMGPCEDVYTSHKTYRIIDIPNILN